MRTVYEASNAVEAHMLQGYLAQEGIATRVDGAYLQGAVGELPAQGFVRLVVDEDDYDRARTAIERWEATEVSDPVLLPPRSPSRGVVAALMGLVIGMAGSYAYFRAPATVTGVDYNHDGVLDDRWVYAPSGLLVESTIDRNLDGRVDYTSHFDQHGEIETAEADDNFDGVFETHYRFKHGNVESSEVDTDGDAYPDLKSYYKHGVLESVEYINPHSGLPVRIEHFYLGKLKSAEVDTDLDGELDKRFLYSGTAEIVSTEAVSSPP